MIQLKRRAMWRRYARVSHLTKLKILLDFRKDVNDWKAEGVYQEALLTLSECTGWAVSTIQDLLSVIREYSKAKLEFWLKEGLSYDHIDRANVIAERYEYTPSDLLDKAILYSPTNDRPMTVEEMVQFASGGKEKAPQNYYQNRMLGWLRKFPVRYGWSAKKTELHAEWLEQGVQRGFFE